MSRIIIDLTDLEMWGGIHGGTQRVVYGIAQYFYLERDSLSEEVVFASFTSADGQFHVSDFGPIMERVNAVKNSPQSSSSQPSSLKAGLKRRLKKYMPETVWRSQKVRRLALQTISVAKKTKRVGQARLSSLRLSQKTAARAPIQLLASDTVLILGKPWDNPDIQKYLSQQKASVGYKLVELAYDMIIPLNPQLHHPSLYTSYTQHMFEALAASDLILAISHSTAKDIREFCRRLRLPVPPIKVIRLGDEVADTTLGGLTKPDARIAANFIACVGTIEVRKNHALLYYVYKLAMEKGIDLPQLVIVGSRGWLSGDFQYLAENDPAMKDKIVILDNVNDQSLAWVYQNCLFTVYPSMYEGWGLPVAESLAVGKLCLASDSSSIPEIAGDLIEYFSPYDVGGCLELIQKYQDKRLLQEKEQAIKKLYKAHDWRNTYRQVVDVIQG